MSEQVKNVISEFMKLSAVDRGTCLEALYETVCDDEDDQLFTELERRRVEFESGRDPGVPMEKVFEKLLGAEK